MAISCQRCQEAPATVHLTDVLSGGEKRERHLCEGCAQEEGLMLKPQEGIASILEEFVKHGASVQETSTAACPDCGITWREFRSHGLLGCPGDYHLFEEQLAPLLKRAHEGGERHAGKVPASAGQNTKRVARLLKLRRDLCDAVEREDYEAAARLRDEIETLDHEQH